MSLLTRKGIRGLIRTAVTGDNPPSGQRLLYPKTDGWYDRDSAGVETNLNLGGGASNETLKKLTVTQANSTVTPAAITEFDTVLNPGTYEVKASLIWQSAATATGASFYLNCVGGAVTLNVGHVYTTSTGGTVTTGIADQATVAGTFQMIESRAWRVNNTDPGSVGGVDTINAHQLSVLEGVIVVTAQTTLSLMFRSEVTASAITMQVGSAQKIHAF